MALNLYAHPLSSYCMKVLVAFYENGVPFEIKPVTLGEEASRAEYLALWPIGKMPVLRDEAKDLMFPESSIIIEYLDKSYPGAIRLLPQAPAAALRTRFLDRFFDLHVQGPMQKIVGERLRPGDAKDPYGLGEARRQLATALDLIDRDLVKGPWAIGEAFTVADCAAAPALFYADKVMPLSTAHPNAARYLSRLTERPSFARALEEAQPYFHLFPQD